MKKSLRDEIFKKSKGWKFQNFLNFFIFQIFKIHKIHKSPNFSSLAFYLHSSLRAIIYQKSDHPSTSANLPRFMLLTLMLSAREICGMNFLASANIFSPSSLSLPFAFCMCNFMKWCPLYLKSNHDDDDGSSQRRVWDAMWK